MQPKMVGLKLFTSLDRFEIMAIPFFILAGNFLTTGGVARRKGPADRLKPSWIDPQNLAR